jgi:hypothetical protein
MTVYVTADSFMVQQIYHVKGILNVWATSVRMVIASNIQRKE